MKEKRFRPFSGRSRITFGFAGTKFHESAALAILFILGIGLSSCAKTPVSTAQPVDQNATSVAAAVATSAQILAPTATNAPSPTATGAVPTATPAQPTATLTEAPTATPPQSLAVLADAGFNAWCAPQEYAGTKPSGPDAPDYARKLSVNGAGNTLDLTVPIPAAYCVLAYRFNQAAPQGAVLTFFDGKSAFLRLPLQAADGHPEEVWAAVNHTYVVNPPLWSVSYRLAVNTANGKELWSNPVTFAKPLPKPCPYGGYPDPVTMYCTGTDPWEVEPHPGIKYPYPRTPNP